MRAIPAYFSGQDLGIAVIPDGNRRARPADMAGARRFWELECWQLAREFKTAIHRFAEAPRVKRDIRFYDQIRDAAASPPRNIAEGFGRRTHADFSRFLDVARGSVAESQNHLRDAVDRGYLGEADFRAMNTLADRTCGAIAALQRYLRGR